jgi:hypothetical protein
MDVVAFGTSAWTTGSSPVVTKKVKALRRRRSRNGISGCSGAWLPPAKYRKKQARDQGNDPEADLYPVLNRRGIPISDVVSPVQKTGIPDPDFSLGKASPEFAGGVDEQINRDDAGDDFIQEKTRSSVRSSRSAWTH